jgi:Na+-translocating ferredoxin:NAD+ oxidoreductase RnfG subunit
MVVGEETDQYIQGITGATISSVALTSSVKKAIQELEKAGGGFEEVPDE